MVFGTILYVSVLLLNAVAILNEERFLSRGEFVLPSRCSLSGSMGPSHRLRLSFKPYNVVRAYLTTPRPMLHSLFLFPCYLLAVGWSGASLQYEQQHSFGGGPASEPGVKERLINLMSAVRTLLRGEYTRRAGQVLTHGPLLWRWLPSSRGGQASGFD